MLSRNASRCGMIVAALLLLSATGCASNTTTSPPVIGAKSQPTPLPASVLQIDPQWQREVESSLKEADSLLKGETTKCSFCSTP